MDSKKVLGYLIKSYLIVRMLRKSKNEEERVLLFDVLEQELKKLGKEFNDD